uniref:Large ribosomal subunit protein mL45 n=1 Tax=Acrobeloides nanus TaxID=290746 RepID=A0A914E6B1_9BILA
MALRLFNLTPGASSNLALLSAGTSTNSYFQRCFVHHHMERDNIERYLGIRRSNTAKSNRNTHVNERFTQKLRGKKSLLIELPTEGPEQKKTEGMTPSELRKSFLRKGINPYKDIAPRNLTAEQIEITSLHDIANQYIPSPSRHKASWNLLSGYSESGRAWDTTKGNVSVKWKETSESLQNWWLKKRMGINRIKKKEGFQNFTLKDFAEQANQIYESSHIALMHREKEKLLTLITESCFSQMWPEVINGTVVWKLLGFNAPSEVVNVYVAEMPPESKSGNEIAQITVKICSKQSLAIYDRFGHLILGDPNEPKDVEEYIVFENHISSSEGVWRMHGKLIPHWLASKPKNPPLKARKLTPEENMVIKSPVKLTLDKATSGSYVEQMKEKTKIKYKEGDLSPEQMEAYAKLEKSEKSFVGRMFTRGKQQKEGNILPLKEKIKVDVNDKDTEEIDRHLEESSGRKNRRQKYSKNK